MQGFSVLLWKELREQWRTARLPVVAAVFLLVGIGSPLLAKYTPELIERFGGDSGMTITMPPPTAKDSMTQIISNMGLVGLLSAILLAMGAVAGEKERGTAALVLTKPVTRPAFLAAKFTALATTLAVGVALAGAAGYFYTTVLFEALPIGGYITGCLLLLLTYVIYMSATLLGSTVLKSAMAAAGIGVAFYVLTSILSPIPGIGKLMPGALAGPAMALALGDAAKGLVGPLVVGIALAAGCMLLAWRALRRQAL